MAEAVAFKTRARTIDHLGREQIADCPTAVSELWKNAYDAYAREVSLNVFDGTVAIATVLDDGHGMSREDFESKWLVVGTETKATEAEVPKSDRKGLEVRVKQGQKGIGRLSSAYLGSLLLLISKRSDTSFVAALIDWRLFENPFIYLHDIKIPLVEFDDRDELWLHLPDLFDSLMGNIWGDRIDIERDGRIAKAWKEFDSLEQKSGRASTREAIETALIETTFSERHLATWPVWDSSATSGTAMLMAHITYDLEAQLQDTPHDGASEAAKYARDKLLQTLVNFTDPFVKPASEESKYSVQDFSYSATAWDGDFARVIISSSRVFSYENIDDLEHIVEGTFNAIGRFTGRVKAFGTWLDEKVIVEPAQTSKTRTDTEVGPFHVRIATFEQLASRTTLSDAVHTQVMSQVERYGGFMVFRNGLRVMPYGRVDNDFFEIEQRRSIHAGREFWSNRRMFGRVALTRNDNPNLRDKAGREGLIDNKAAKLFRDLVTNLLTAAARRFFGTDSEIRSKRVPEIEEKYKKQKAEEAHQKLKSRKRREFRKNLTANLPRVQRIELELIDIATLAGEGSLPTREAELLQLRQRISDLRAERASLALGAAPKNLGSAEAAYSEYRRSSSNAAELLVRATDSISFALEKSHPKTPMQTAVAEINRNAAYLNARLRRLSAAANEILQSEGERLASIIAERGKRYSTLMLPYVAQVEDKSQTLSWFLDKAEQERDREDTENSEIFESYVSVLRSLQESVDLDALISFSVEDADEVRTEISRLNALAQLGITVEIIGHEMDGLESIVTRGLDSLPAEVKATRTMLGVVSAHQTLVEKLRFLSPLKLSGDRSKIWITGVDIHAYVQGFLGDILKDRRIDLQVTPEFLGIRIYELPSRIYPVFINLVNNSAYWLAQNEETIERLIVLDARNKCVIVADNGPGVDAADVRSLFTLFFTRKVRSGRGVGLYLCRANLAAGGHNIWYGESAKERRLSGANFVIEFKGAEYA